MKALVRSTLFLLLATLITAPFGLFVTLAVVAPMQFRFWLISVWRAGFMAICQHVLGIHYRVIGRENIPATASVILSKHQSAWETVGLQAIFPPLVFVLKKSLLMIPFLGWAFAAVKMISIDRNARKDAMRQVVDQGCERLKAGYWVIIFPEGTRIAPGETRRFKAGGAQLALASGALAVPVAHNAGEYWARNAFIKKPGLITVSIGPAIDPAGKTAAEVTELAERWIAQEMRRISPHRYAKKPPKSTRPRSPKPTQSTRSPHSAHSPASQASTRSSENTPEEEQLLAAEETPRSIALGEQIVSYTLRRARRRTIGLSIDHRGLRVGAPPRATLKEIETLILRHGAWVTQKLDEWRSWQRPQRLAIEDGVCLPMLGETLLVRVVQGNNRATWSAHLPATVTLAVRHPDDAAQVLENALRERAHQLFQLRLEHFSGLLGLATVPSLGLSSARTRWGSCSRKSGIRLNWRLIHFPLHIVDYVVAHELAHVREMNHSPRFWDVVSRIYPQHKHAHQELKQLASVCPRW